MTRSAIFFLRAVILLVGAGVLAGMLWEPQVEGRNVNKNGAYHHLLLVKVLRGNPLKTSEVWKGKHFSYSQSQLGQEYDSVEGGPHRPLTSGPGADDSIIYVVYDASKCARVYRHLQTEVVALRGACGVRGRRGAMLQNYF